MDKNILSHWDHERVHKAKTNKRGGIVSDKAATALIVVSELRIERTRSSNRCKPEAVTGRGGRKYTFLDSVRG